MDFGDRDVVPDITGAPWLGANHELMWRAPQTVLVCRMRSGCPSVCGWNTRDWLIGGEFRQPNGDHQDCGDRVAMAGLCHGQTTNEVHGLVLAIAWYVLGVRARGIRDL